MAGLEKLVTRISGLVLFGLLRFLIKITRQNKPRMQLLMQLGETLGFATSRFDNPHTIAANRDLSPQGGFVVINQGVKIMGRAAERNLKASGNAQLEGFDIIDDLAKVGMKNPKTIVDVGANFGEISMCFAKRFPEARIVAIEPVQANLDIMRDNLAIQDFDTGKIEILKLAVSDDLDEVKITNHLGSQNSIVAKRNLSADKYETVPCKGINHIFKEQGINQCDFLKIDIEGAEPDICRGLSEILGKVHVVQLEFSYKNTPENYAKLVQIFIHSSDTWKCVPTNNLTIEIPLEKVMCDFAAVKGNKPCRNYWFMKEA